MQHYERTGSMTIDQAAGVAVLMISMKDIMLHFLYTSIFYERAVFSILTGVQIRQIKMLMSQKVPQQFQKTKLVLLKKGGGGELLWMSFFLKQ